MEIITINIVVIVLEFILNTTMVLGKSLLLTNLNKIIK